MTLWSSCCPGGSPAPATPLSWLETWAQLPRSLRELKLWHRELGAAERGALLCLPGEGALMLWGPLFRARSQGGGDHSTLKPTCSPFVAHGRPCPTMRCWAVPQGIFLPH